jgi:hypothetical protein
MWMEASVGTELGYAMLRGTLTVPCVVDGIVSMRYASTAMQP